MLQQILPWVGHTKLKGDKCMCQSYDPNSMDEIK